MPTSTPPPPPSLKAQPLQCVQRLAQLHGVDLLNSHSEDRHSQHLTDGKVEVSTVQSLARWCAVTTKELALSLCMPSPVLSHRGLSDSAPGTPRSPESRGAPAGPQ